MKLESSLPADELHQIPEYVRQAEKLGFDTVWIRESKGDPMLALTLAAEHTSRMRIGTGIMIAFARSPMVTAYQSWALQKFSGGRFALGLGSQVKAHVERRFNMPYDAPGPRMKDLVRSIQAIWDCWQNGTRLNYQGEYYKFSLMTPHFDLGPIAQPAIPILTAGVNPYMCKLAGEVANGLHVHPFLTRRYARDVMLPAVTEGLQKSGRTRRQFELACPVFAVTGEGKAEIEANRQIVRKQIAFYGSTPQYQGVMRIMGWEEIGEQLGRKAKAGQWDEMTTLITDEIMDEMVVTAPPETLGEKLRERWDSILDSIAIYHPRPLSDEAFWRRIHAALHE